MAPAQTDDWDRTKLAIAERWPMVSPADLAGVECHRHQLIALISDKADLTQAEAAEDLADWEALWLRPRLGLTQVAA